MDIDINLLYSVQNLLQFINDNWTSITIIIALAITIAKKAKVYFSKSDDEKIAIAKKQIQETMLKLITDAEVDYIEWSKAGNIKRAQVIENVFATYPVLSKVADQEELIAWIDDVINESLETMRDIFEENSNLENIEQEIK